MEETKRLAAFCAGITMEGLPGDSPLYATLKQISKKAAQRL